MYTATPIVRYDSIDTNFLQQEGVQMMIVDYFEYSEKEERTTSSPPIQCTQICHYSKSGALIRSEEYDECQALFQIQYFFYQQDGRLRVIQERGLGGYEQSVQFRYFDAYNIVVEIRKSSGMSYEECCISKYDKFGNLLMNKVNSSNRQFGNYEMYNYFINGSIFSYRTKMSVEQLSNLFTDQTIVSGVTSQYPYSEWFHRVFLRDDYQVVERDGQIVEASVLDNSGNVNACRKFEYYKNGLLKTIETKNSYNEIYEIITFRYFQDRESLVYST